MEALHEEYTDMDSDEVIEQNIEAYHTLANS